MAWDCTCGKTRTTTQLTNKPACTPDVIPLRQADVLPDRFASASCLSLPAESSFLSSHQTTIVNNMSLQVPYRPKANGDAHGATKAVILVSLPSTRCPITHRHHHHAQRSGCVESAYTNLLCFHRWEVHLVALAFDLCPSTSPRLVAPPLPLHWSIWRPSSPSSTAQRDSFC